MRNGWLQTPSIVLFVITISSVMYSAMERFAGYVFSCLYALLGSKIVFGVYTYFTLYLVVKRENALTQIRVYIYISAQHNTNLISRARLTVTFGRGSGEVEVQEKR